MKKSFKFRIILAVFILMVLIWNPFDIFNKPREIVFKVIYPFQILLANSANKISFFNEAIWSIGDIKKENEKLILENVYLRAEKNKLEYVAQENEILRQELDILPRKKFDLVGAKIIGRNLQKGNDWFLIDRGIKDDLKKNAPVVVANGVLIGKVEEVFNNSARVVSITNPISNISVTDVNTGAIGVVRGEYGLGLLLDMVMQTDVLKEGDNLVTSEISQNIPAGLLVGRINEIHSSQDYLFQQAIVTAPVDFSKVRFVFVIK